LTHEHVLGARIRRRILRVQKLRHLTQGLLSIRPVGCQRMVSAPSLVGQDGVPADRLGWPRNATDALPTCFSRKRAKQ
jgi:hypothetical protein